MPTPYETTIMLPNDVPLTLAKIPSGTFQMGSPNTERNRDSDEGLVHTVNIGYDFYMGKYEVTQKQWLAVMGSWPDSTYNPDMDNGKFGRSDSHPMYFVSWNDAKNFITALNTHIANTGQGPLTVRLPSEAEWEYACRAGTQTRFFFGDSLDCGDEDEDCAAGTLPGNRSDYMWYRFNCQGNANGAYGTKPVGTKLPNQFGLYDIHGNVWEWCEDDYHLDYTGAPADGSAWVDNPRGSGRAGRGGSYYGYARSCRSASRSASNPSLRSSGYGGGFRVVLRSSGR